MKEGLAKKKNVLHLGYQMMIRVLDNLDVCIRIHICQWKLIHMDNCNSKKKKKNILLVCIIQRYSIPLIYLCIPQSRMYLLSSNGLQIEKNNSVLKNIKKKKHNIINWTKS